VNDRDRDEALFDAWTRDYARLGLEMERHVPGTVAAWLGPPAWRVQVEAAPAMSAAALRDAADELLLGVRPRREPEPIFDAALAELDGLLPGTGSRAERYRAWREAVAVPADRVPDVLACLTAKGRARTRKHLPLPNGERVDFAFGADLPYRAYTRFLGRGRSRVEVHTGRPLPFDELVDYASHEAYPGHHTEHALREHHLYRGGSQGEYAIQLVNTPASLIWEAVATCARDAAFGPEWGLAELATDGAIPVGRGADPERDARIWGAVGRLESAQGNASFLLHVDERPDADVAAYLADRLLMSEGAAAGFAALLRGFPWRIYVFTYGLGRRLLAPRLAGPDRWSLLHRLLTEPAYPALLSDDAPVADSSAGS
jgi:hypothetical protein